MAPPSSKALDAVTLSVTAGGGVRLLVHAKPRAKKTSIVGAHGDALSIAVAAPPVDGAANEELIRFLGSLFGVPKAHVTLVRGASARNKLFEVSGTTVERVRAAVEDDSRASSA